MGKLKLTEKRRGSLYGIFLRITLLPLICLGIVLILFGIVAIMASHDY